MQHVNKKQIDIHHFRASGIFLLSFNDFKMEHSILLDSTTLTPLYKATIIFIAFGNPLFPFFEDGNIIHWRGPILLRRWSAELCSPIASQFLEEKRKRVVLYYD